MCGWGDAAAGGDGPRHYRVRVCGLALAGTGRLFFCYRRRLFSRLLGFLCRRRDVVLTYRVGKQGEPRRTPRW